MQAVSTKPKTKPKLHISYNPNTRVSITAQGMGSEYIAKVEYEHDCLGKEIVASRTEAEIAAMTMLEQLGVAPNDIDRLGTVLDHDGKLKQSKGMRLNTTLSLFLG